MLTHRSPVIAGFLGAVVFGCLKAWGASTDGALLYGVGAAAYSMMVLRLWRWASPNRLRRLGVVAWSATILFLLSWLLLAGAASLTVVSCDFHGDPAACRRQRILLAAAAVSLISAALSGLGLAWICVAAFRSRHRATGFRPKAPARDHGLPRR